MAMADWDLSQVRVRLGQAVRMVCKLSYKIMFIGCKNFAERKTSETDGTRTLLSNEFLGHKKFWELEIGL